MKVADFPEENPLSTVLSPCTLTLYSSTIIWSGGITPAEKHMEESKMKFAVIYYSKTGHTREMGEEIAEGIRKQGGGVKLFSIEEPLDNEYISECSGVIFGTPVYLANTCWQMKKWFDTDSASVKLAGKLGGVYSTAHFAQGGGDVALMTLIGHMLVKGMMIYSGGSALGKPYIHLGPVALDAVEGHYENSRELFRIFGERFAAKAGELFENKNE